MIKPGISLLSLAGFIFLLLTIALANAQTEHPVSFNVGGGYTPPVGRQENRLNNGWNITGGVA